MQNKPNFQKSQMNVNTYTQKYYENKSNWTLGQNKPNSNPISNAGKRTKEAKKKKRVSGTFLRLWVAGKIDFLDGCDIL
jgi:hypothetical protein